MIGRFFSAIHIETFFKATGKSQTRTRCKSEVKDFDEYKFLESP